MEISSNLINLQKSVYIASFTILIFDPLKKPFSFALNVIKIWYDNE